MKYSIDGEEFSLHVEGPLFVGNDSVLSMMDDDISRGCSWADSGYVVEDFFPDKLYEEVYAGISGRIWRALGMSDGQGLSLEDYHRYCSTGDMHIKAISALRYGFPLEEFPVDFRLLDDRISDICGSRVSCAHKGRVAANRFCIRVVRPRRYTDNNPPHRDVWLDRLRDAINIYVPLAGSNGKSSLPLIPGSHRWRECDLRRTAGGARVEGVEFSVPCVVSSTYGMDMVRPPVGRNQVLVFSPYLVHGGAVNCNEDMTRVSLEVRFWRQ